MKLKRITQVALNINHSTALGRTERTNHDYCSTLILIINWRCTTFIPICTASRPTSTFRTCQSVSQFHFMPFIQSRIHIILSSFPSLPGLLLPPTKQHSFQWDFGRHAGVVLPKRILRVTSYTSVGGPIYSVCSQWKLSLATNTHAHTPASISRTNGP